MSDEFGQASAAPEAAPVEVAVDTPEVSSPSIEQTMSKAFDTSVAKQEARDEKRREFVRSSEGKFARKVNAVSPSRAQAAPPVNPTQQAVPTDQLDAPNSWPAELKAEFGKLPPSMRSYLAGREREAHQKITTLGQAAKEAEHYRQVSQRYTNTMRGLAPQEAFERWAAASDYLDRNPAEAIQWLAKAYNVDMGSLSGQPSGAAPEALQAVYETLNQSHQVDARSAQIGALVSDFSADKPYWSEIEDDVANQVMAIRAANPHLPDHVVLQKAYDRALKLNDGVQARINSETRAEAERVSRTEAARKARDAKKNASVNVRSTVGVSPRATGSWEQTMREVGERLMGR